MDNTTFVSWQEDPARRGTAGLVWSCLVTLALCVWSALHLNIPAKDISNRSYYLSLLKWVLVGVLAPEVIVWTAWRQSHSAKLLTKKINLALHQKHSFPNYRAAQGNPYHVRPQRRHTWTDLQSYYVVMGGLVIDPLDSRKPDMSHIPRRFGRLTLTPRAAIDLAEEGLLPDLDPNVLKDKSKSNAWAKLVVMIQALWFILQVFARLFKELPVSLLELNTTGHVLCALVIYILWWDKPAQVHQPTVLREPWVATLGTAWFMLSRVSGANYGSSPLTPIWVAPELAGLTYSGPTSHEPSDSTSAPFVMDIWSQDIAERTATSPQAAIEHPCHHAGHFMERMFPDTAENRKSTSRKQRISNFLGYHETDHYAAADAEAFLPVVNSTIRRHALCAQAIQTYSSQKKYFELISSSPALDYVSEQRWTARCKQLLVVNAMNLPSDFLIHEENGWATGTTILWVASFIYANIHLLAWNEVFPHPVECSLWRISATYIGGSSVLAMVFCASWQIIRGWRRRFLNMKSHIAEYVILGMILATAASCYALARVYMTVEGFVALRHAPAAMYDTVRWAQYLPHF